MPDKSHPEKKIDLLCSILKATSDCLVHVAEYDEKRSVYEMGDRNNLASEEYYRL